MEIKEIRLLNPEEITTRVQSVHQYKTNGVSKVGVMLLLYKDARVDMNLLDEVYGRNNWQRTHEVINGNLFCNIDLWDDVKKCWVRKQDVGTESNTQKEKGQASDSFKRAATNVGIGRELYTAPTIFIELNDSEYTVDDKKNIKVKAVVITSPTYEGIVSDIKKIAEIVHGHNSILIVDEAHGAHMILSDEFPTSAYKLGADIVIESAHKTLPAMTQTAFLHVQGDKVSVKDVQRMLSVYQSSSPSYVLMSSLDKCIRELPTKGQKDVNEMLITLNKFHNRVKNLKVLKVLDRSIIGKNSVYDFDISKIVIFLNMKLRSIEKDNVELNITKLNNTVSSNTVLSDTVLNNTLLSNTVSDKAEINNAKLDNAKTNNTELSTNKINETYDGKYLESILREKYNFEIEMCSKDYVIGMTSICDNMDEILRLADNLVEIDNYIADKIKDKSLLEQTNTGILLEKTEHVMTIYEALLCKKEKIDVCNAVGRVSAGYVYIYPPEIPIIVPGDLITNQMLKKIMEYKMSNLNIKGIDNEKIIVIKR